MPAGIFRARRRAWMECAETVEPLQHPRTAWEVSRRGAMASPAGRKKERNAAEKRQGSYRGCGGARAGVAGEDPVCAGEAERLLRELPRRAPMASGAEKRRARGGRRLVREEADPKPPRGLYGRRGRGSG